MTPISIQLYTVRELTADGNHLAVLKQIADIGYAGVEGSGYGYSNAEFRKVVEDLGMVVSSGWGALPTPETVGDFIDGIQALGTTHAVIGLWKEEFANVDAIRNTANRINTVLPAIRAAGLTLSMHNHWMEFEMRDGRLAADWLAEFCPDLLYELDIYWATNHGANDEVAMVERFRDRIELLHVKDGPKTEGEPMTAVGHGTLNIAGAIGAANPDMLKWLIVELDQCATDMMEAVRESYEYLVGWSLGQGTR